MLSLLNVCCRTDHHPTDPPTHFRDIVIDVRLIMIVLFLGCIFGSAHLSIAGILDKGIADQPDAPWDITADEVIFDQQNNEYIAKGKVVITKGSTKIAADYVRFHADTMKAFASGNVMVTGEGDILTGKEMEIDLNREVGTVYDGSIFLKEKHFYITGKKIEKTGKVTYALEDGSLTSCDGKSPAWKITGRKMKVNMDEYGYVRHATFKAKNVPILYTPLFVFPTRRDRKSGFLLPEFATSDRKGIEYNQPYYWAINRSSDATFYAHYMNERGLKLGTEYRYVLSPESNGTIMLDYLDDRKIDDGKGNNSENYGFTDDNFLRPNSDRYWLRAKLNQQLPYQFTSRLDLDVVSDQDYLKEFKYGYSGYEKTKREFEEHFGRDIDDIDETVRTNKLNANRLWSRYSLNGEIVWNDNVIARRQDITNLSVQELPSIDFDASKQPIFQSPYYFTLESEFTNFIRPDADKAYRLDIYPRFYWPIKFKQYFFFEPSVGLRQTAYNVYKFGEGDTDRDKFPTRELFDVNLELFTNVFNTFDVNGKEIDRIKHTIRPTLSYEYIPEVDQSNLPLFEPDNDRIARRNLLKFNLTNTLTSRSPKKKANARRASASQPQYNYDQLVWLKLVQAYDINEANEDNPDRFTDGENRRPFTPLYYFLDLKPIPYIKLQAEGEWSYYDVDFIERNLALSLNDRRGDRLFLEHRYSRSATTLDPNSSDIKIRENLESFYADVSVRATDRLSVYGRYERNLEEDQDLLKQIGLVFTFQCWALDLNYIEEEQDRSFGFRISLSGLGEIGQRFSPRSITSPFSN